MSTITRLLMIVFHLSCSAMEGQISLALAPNSTASFSTTTTVPTTAIPPTTTAPPVVRSFEIDYANDRFLKDGKPFRYASGSLHYFRVHEKDWADRLKKMRLAGLNAVQTYVEWSSHEPEEGVYDFSGGSDLEEFIRIAQAQDLLVILRVGPFICAERDMGGLPYWLMSLHPDIRLRTTDSDFLKYSDRWMSNILLPKMKPLLYHNGGPIIMVQVENEYGSNTPYDLAYTVHLRNVFRQALGDEVILFTTDSTGTNNLRNGKISNVYATVDFGIGADPKLMFAAQRLFEPQGPLVNSEFYPGWIDHWGEPHHKTNTEDMAKALDAILALNASVNMYMFHGGTSFGLSSGSNAGYKFQSCPTSYDYNAPLSEAGDLTDKYFAVRTVLRKYFDVPSGPLPPPSPKGDYGPVELSPVNTIWNLAQYLPKDHYQWPVTFEHLRVSNGLVIYETTLTFRITNPAKLSIFDVHDRGYVFVDRRYAGVVSREEKLYEIPVYGLPGSVITIIVESQGRISVGPLINDFKGLTTNVTLSGKTLEGWLITPLPLRNLTRLTSALDRLQQNVVPVGTTPEEDLGTPEGGMTLYRGTLDISELSEGVRETFLRLEGWRKGVVWVNDFCLGRYWPDMGPQVTLYVPHGVLRMGINRLMVLELEASPCVIPGECYVIFQDTHQVDGPTPQ